MAKLKVDVIVAIPTPAAVAAKNATATPIVNGFNIPPWPPAYDFVIREYADGSAEVVSAQGTRFPSFEVWQYGGPGGPRPVYLYNTSGSVWDLRGGMGPLPTK